MTKEEAIKAMKEGKKVKHLWFTPDEWMKQDFCWYEFEDGCKCDRDEFWRWRDDDSWLTGWSVVD